MAEADPYFSKAITAQVLTASPFDFASQLRARAVELRADLDAGSLLHFHGGVHTREDVAAAVEIDGGFVLPSSVGVVEFAK